MTPEPKRIIEALLFAAGEPLSLQKIHEIVASGHETTLKEIKQTIGNLQKEYADEGRAFRLEAIAEGFVLRTHSDFAPFVRLLFSSRRNEKLSSASMEVLAIVAYKQPITKASIERIRGVDSSGVLQHLAERELIEVCGKAEACGRPSLYGTTKEFLKYFGLNKLDELPSQDLALK